MDLATAIADFERVGAKIGQMHYSLAENREGPYNRIKTWTHFDLNFGNIFSDREQGTVDLIDLGSLSKDRPDFLQDTYHFTRILKEISANFLGIVIQAQVADSKKGGQAVALGEDRPLNLNTYYFTDGAHRPLPSLSDLRKRVKQLEPQSLLKRSLKVFPETNLRTSLRLYAGFVKGYTRVFPEPLKKSFVSYFSRSCQTKILDTLNPALNRMDGELSQQLLREVPELTNCLNSKLFR